MSLIISFSSNKEAFSSILALLDKDLTSLNSLLSWKGSSSLNLLSNILCSSKCKTKI